MQVERRSSTAALAIAAISIPIFIGAMDLTVVSAVLPSVLVDLEIPLSDFDKAAWIISGYLLAYTVSMTFMGRLSDLYGRKRVFLIALTIFALGSFLVAASDTWLTQMALRAYYTVASGRPDPAQVSLLIIIASRVVQAFGAGAMVPVGMALVGDLYPSTKRAKVLGLIAAVDTAGWVVGHLYGGIIVRYWNWQAIFWLNLPVCLIGYFVLKSALRDIDETKNQGTMDWLGAALITSSLSALILGLGTSSETSSTVALGDSSALPPFALPAMLLSLALLILFIWRQSSIPYPLIELSLFRRMNFTPANIANLLVGFGLFIAIANVPLFINTLVAVTPEQGAWESGWVLSALTIPMAIAAVPGGWLTERTNYRLPAILGLIAAIIGFGLMTGWEQTTPYVTMIPQLVLVGVGFGITLAPIATAAVNASPKGYRGTGSALVIIFRLLGMTAGVSSITTYGLKRAEVLAAQILPNSANLNITGLVGVEVAERVISETFIIAGVASLLALIPVSFLRLKATNNKGASIDE